MPDQKIANNIFAGLYKLSRSIGREISNTLETVPEHPSRRVAEVNKFVINRQKQATHVSGRQKHA